MAGEAAKGSGTACDLITALSLSRLDPGRKQGHVAVIVLGKQTNLQRDREQLLGYRRYQGKWMWPASSQHGAASLPGPGRGWRGQKGNKNKFGLPGGTEGVFVMA